MALSKIGNPKSGGIGAQLQAYIEKKAGESVEALQGAMSMPPIQPGQPIRGQKRRRVRMTGERISVPIVKVSPSDDTANTEGALAQCIIKAVVSRNLLRQPRTWVFSHLCVTGRQHLARVLTRLSLH